MALLKIDETATPSAPRGSALLALGFRPFYLLAGLYAALSVPLWALQYAGWLAGANPLWHAHEMLFGYAFAVIAGFLLTAVRAWTLQPTPTGVVLAGIASLWVLARILGLFSLPAASLADALFAVAIAWGIGRPILASGNRKLVLHTSCARARRDERRLPGVPARRAGHRAGRGAPRHHHHGRAGDPAATISPRKTRSCCLARPRF